MYIGYYTYWKSIGDLVNKKTAIIFGIIAISHSDKSKCYALYIFNQLYLFNQKKLSGSNILQIFLAPSAHTWAMHYTCCLVANIAQ
jgi:hypothetical protein